MITFVDKFITEPRLVFWHINTVYAVTTLIECWEFRIKNSQKIITFRSNLQ